MNKKYKNKVEDRMKKKIFWHIDYLITNSSVTLQHTYLNLNEQSTECQNLAAFSKDAEIAILSNFGSSDCKEKCGGHLLTFVSPIKDLQPVQSYLEANGWKRFILIKNSHIDIKKEKRENSKACHG